MDPYANLVTVTFLLFITMTRSRGYCVGSEQQKDIRSANSYNCISPLRCLWCTTTWWLAENYYMYTQQTYTGDTAEISSDQLCPENRQQQYCLKFQYDCGRDQRLTVSLRQQGLNDSQLWAVSGSHIYHADDFWSNALVPIPETHQKFNILITALHSQEEIYYPIYLRNIVLSVRSACITEPSSTGQLKTISTMQETTLSTSKSNADTRATTSAAKTKTTDKATAATASLQWSNLSVMTTVIKTINRLPAVSDAERSDVTSPVTAVAVSVTVAVVVIVVVPIIVFIKRRQLCLFIKRQGTPDNHSGGRTKPGCSVDLADMSPPPVLYSAVAKKRGNPLQSPPDNAPAQTSHDDISVYQNLASSRIPDNIKNNDYVNGSKQPYLYNFSQECDQSNEDSVGIYHVIQHDPQIKCREENSDNKDSIYSLAQTPSMTSPYNALDLQGGAAVIPRDVGSHDVYNHLAEEEGTYHHANVTRTNGLDLMNDEYSLIQVNDLSSVT